MGALRRNLGARLRHLRKARGWTQQELAARAGMDYKYIGAVERGERNVTIDNVERIVRALRVEPYEAFLFSLKEGRREVVTDEVLAADLIRDAGPSARPLLVSVLNDVLRWSRASRKRR